MSAIVYSPFLKTAHLISHDEIFEVIDTLRIWKRYFKSVTHEKALDKRSSMIVKDFILVTRLLQYDMRKIKEGSEQKLILVKDNIDQIQSMISFKISDPSTEAPKMRICQLLTAPWNLRLNIKLYDNPMHGSGVVAFVAALFFAKKTGASEISLSSTPSGTGFYRCIGMKNTAANRFTIDINKDAVKKLLEIFLKATKTLAERGEKIEFRI